MRRSPISADGRGREGALPAPFRVDPGVRQAHLAPRHVSWLDVPLLGAVRPARMPAKSAIRHWPVAGALAARGGVLFLDRARPRALPAPSPPSPECCAAVRRLRRSFPEGGGTWCGRARGTFRRAVFQAALDAGVPVQPVRIRYRTALDGPATAVAFVGEDTLLASLRRVPRPGA